MAHNGDVDEVQSLAVLPPDSRTLVVEAIDEIFEIDEPTAALSLVDAKMRQLDPQKAGVAYETMHIALQAMGSFFQAIRSVQNEGDFAKAHDQLKVAVEGFDQIGHEELRDLSVGLGAYTLAVIELQQLNVGRALELFEEMKEYLRNAGKFSQRFEVLIDHTKPEALYLAGAKALLSADIATAEALFQQASQAAEKVAQDYYPVETAMHSLFQGMAQYYRAYFRYFKAWNDFIRFEYDRLVAEEDLAREAALACEFLEKHNARNVSVSATYIWRLSRILHHLLESIGEFAYIMQGIFHSTFKYDLGTLNNLRRKIRAASASAAEAGPQAVSFVRFCDQLTSQVNNLERLARPRSSDFGKFSGLVAMAIFLPVLIVVAWANFQFTIGLDASTLLITCALLALIGGFGFGAVKFKSLFLPALSKE